MKKDRFSGFNSDVGNFRSHHLRLTSAPLIDAADQIRRAFGPDYVSPFLNGEIDQKVALHGVAAGLLINGQVVIDRFISYAQKETGGRLQKVYELGPKIGEAPWATAICAGANYVRHGDEWWEEAQIHFKKLGMMNNGLVAFKNDDVEEKIVPSMEAAATSEKKNSAVAKMIPNIRSLRKAGLSPRAFLIGGNHYFEVAEGLGLFNLDVTLSRFEGFQNSVGQQAGWFD